MRSFSFSPSSLRISRGMVVCPLLVSVDCDICSLRLKIFLTFCQNQGRTKHDKEETVKVVDASKACATIRNRCSGKEDEKAKTLKTRADPAAAAACCWAGELEPPFPSFFFFSCARTHG